MKTKTYLGRINVHTGEHTNAVSLLLVANSDAAAAEVLKRAAADYYGTSDQFIPGRGYEVNGGELYVSSGRIDEIGLATFLDLRRCLRVKLDVNVSWPSEADLTKTTQDAARSLHSALAKKYPDITHSDVLNALASAWGEKTWQVLRAKLESPAALALQDLKRAAQEVVDWADATGCGEELTVTSSEAVKDLSRALKILASADALASQS